MCREFMESFGWSDLFSFARGEERRAWVKTAFGAKNCVTAPSFEERLTAYKLIASYGYGTPRAQIDVTSGGRSVTDLLLAAMGRGGGVGVQGEGGGGPGVVREGDTGGGPVGEGAPDHGVGPRP